LSNFKSLGIPPSALRDLYCRLFRITNKKIVPGLWTRLKNLNFCSMFTNKEQKFGAIYQNKIFQNRNNTLFKKNGLRNELQHSLHDYQ